MSYYCRVVCVSQGKDGGTTNVFSLWMSCCICHPLYWHRNGYARENCILSGASSQFGSRCEAVSGYRRRMNQPTSFTLTT